MDTAKLVAASKRKRHSQAELAEEVGVSCMTILRWKNGQSEPQEDNLQRLCEVLGLTPGELFPDEIILPTEDIVISPPKPTQYIQTFLKHDLTTRLWSLASTQHTNAQEVHSAMTRILKDYDTMHKNHQMTRRKALWRLVALPIATLGLAAFNGEETPSPTIARDILAQCTVGVSACWELRKSAEHDDRTQAFSGVSTYLPALQRIVKDSTQDQKEAANLAAQCLLLQSILSRHLGGLGNALYYAQQSLPYVNDAKDPSLKLKALEVLALIYTYSKRYQQAQQTMEQTVPLLKRKDVALPPQILARTNGMLACALARNGQDGSVYLERAGTFFPDAKNQKQNLRTPDSGSPIYAEYSINDLFLDTGIAYIYSGKGEEAIETLSEVVDPQTFALKLSWSESMRIEAINYMAMASIHQKNKDMEQTIHFWTGGIEAAKKSQSEQRFNEALTAYDIMQAIWPGEARIKELRDFTEHW